jgi:restriction endonuclease S subunit
LPVIIFDDFTTAIKFVDFPFKVKSSAMKILHAKKSAADIRFLYYLMQKIKFTNNEHKRYWISEYSKIKIPLPPIEVQQQIVAELDGYQKIIDGTRAVAENWKPSFVVDPKWPIKKLGEISERVTKGTTPTTAGFNFQETGINFIKIETIDDAGYFLKEKFAHINEECNKEFKRSQLKSGDVLFSIAGALGRVALVQNDILPANTNQALAIITPKSVLSSKYLEQVLRSNLIFDKIDNLKVGVAQYNISLTQVSDFDIPLPSLEIQKQIVAKIEEEQKMVEANKKLMDIFQQKIKDKIAEIWGE